MNYFRKLLRFIIAVAITPIVWFLLIPLSLLMDFLEEEDVTKSIIAGHWSWLTFK